MQFDRMGRRIEYLETCGSATNANNTFTYDNYLLVARHRDNLNGTFSTDRFIWDPTEPVATRPLVFYNSNAQPQYYTHDGNKNVSDLTDIDKSVSAHYRYEPFGKVATQCDILVPENPFRFSGEYTDSETAMVYYNYRHYEPIVGRWCGRDRIEQAKNLFVMVDNMVSSVADRLGLEFVVVNHEAGISPPKGWVKDATAQTELTKLIDISIIPTSKGCDSGCAKFDVIFPKIKIDVYYKDEYSRVQSYPDEMEHVECYRKWHDKLINIASRAQNKPCMRPIDANAAIDLFVGESDNAAKECDKCNGSLDAKGGSHGH
jgi:RHS repeat-associated protein